MPSSRAATAAAASLARLYGPMVRIRYHDVTKLETQHQFAAELAHFHEERWPFPITLIDQTVTFVGRLQPLNLVGAVAAYLKQRGVSLPIDAPQNNHPAD